MEFKISKKIISSSSDTYIIVEIGLNHNGDIGLAKKCGVNVEYLKMFYNI